jgi:hypothetical protein
LKLRAYNALLGESLAVVFMQTPNWTIDPGKTPFRKTNGNHMGEKWPTTQVDTEFK